MVRRYRRRKAKLSLEEWGDIDCYEDDDILIVVPDDGDWPEGW